MMARQAAAVLASEPANNGEDEEAIDPARLICDAHHHLWNLEGSRYLLPDFMQDCSTGHRIAGSVYVEWRSHYRDAGPMSMRPVGETTFASAVADVASTSSTRACAAIVGFADLALGTAVTPVLEAHLEAGNGRFRGIRNVASWDPDPDVMNGPLICAPGLYRNKRFREGFALLERFGLSFDAMFFQTQLEDLISLADAFPHQPIVLNHLGGILGIGAYAGCRESLFQSWRKWIGMLADRPNVFIKLGGLGMRRAGLGFHGQRQRPGSIELAAAWRPWIEFCIEAFGTERCMFESNFPVDKASCSYAVLWNTFKRLAGGASEAQKDELFLRTASRFYRIDLD
jgi:L-fuconolactonase